MKRLFDIILSFIGLLLLAPIMLIVAVIIKLTSRGPVFYSQKRVGLDEKIFLVHKFRSMVDKADTLGTSVTTAKDSRITPIGALLRKTKLDELPQLFNVLAGEMSFIGPRPEVPEITARYTPEMKKIFCVRPGITSVATLHFRQEEVILAKVSNPDQFYEEVVVPLKVSLAMQHVTRNSFWFDFKILVQTVWVLLPLGKVWPIEELSAVKEFRKEHSL